MSLGRVPSPSQAPSPATRPRPVASTPEIRQQARRRAEADGPEGAGWFVIYHLLFVETGGLDVTSLCRSLFHPGWGTGWSVAGDFLTLDTALTLVPVYAAGCPREAQRAIASWGVGP